MIFDTHAHYDDRAFDADREALLSSFKANGIGRVVNISSSLESCDRTLELAQHYSWIYAAIGIHPSDCAELTEQSLERLKKLCLHEKCVAVGEIGLDYYWKEPAPQLQKKWFVRQLEMARELEMPVVIHSRDAAKDTIDVMRGENAGEIGGVIHCYSYSKESARAFLDMGFYFGIGGVITFKNGRKLREAVEYIPMDRIVLETDSPYLAPEPNRGKRNNSLHLGAVLEALAGIKGLTRAETERVTWENAVRLYRMNGKEDTDTGKTKG